MGDNERELGREEMADKRRRGVGGSEGDMRDEGEGWETRLKRER